MERDVVGGRGEVAVIAAAAVALTGLAALVAGRLRLGLRLLYSVSNLRKLLYLISLASISGNFLLQEDRKEVCSNTLGSRALTKKSEGVSSPGLFSRP